MADFTVAVDKIPRRSVQSRLLVALQQANRPLSVTDLMLRTGLRGPSIQSELYCLINMDQVEKVQNNGSVLYRVPQSRMDASVANNREGTPA